MKHLPIITNSQITCFRRCEREHYYAYVLGYRSPAESEALRFGTLWHKAMEAWWLGQGLERAIELGCDGTADEYEAARMRVLLRGYDARWGQERHDVVAVEREFVTPIVHPLTGEESPNFQLAGKLDVLLANRFVEHKTTSRDISLGASYWKALTMATQVSTYYAGAKALGHEVHGCIYDVVRKVSLRPLKAIPVLDANGDPVVVDAGGMRVKTRNGGRFRRTANKRLGQRVLTREETVADYEARVAAEVSSDPDRYFQRAEIVRLEADETDSALDTWSWAGNIARSMRMTHVPRNPDACVQFDRVCQYFDVCSRVVSIHDPTRFAVVTNVHPELSKETSQP